MEKSYDWLKKFNKSVTLATEAVIIVLMAIMAVVTIAQVFMRYVMHSPIRWSKRNAIHGLGGIFCRLGIAGTHIDWKFFKIFLTQKFQKYHS